MVQYFVYNGEEPNPSNLTLTSDLENIFFWVFIPSTSLSSFSMTSALIFSLGALNRRKKTQKKKRIKYTRK
jgi:hypothetical protein